MVTVMFRVLILVLLLAGCAPSQPASPFQEALETLTRSLPRFSINSRERIIIYGCICDGYQAQKKETVEQTGESEKSGGEGLPEARRE